MDSRNEHTMEDQDLNTTQEVSQEQKEVSETPSDTSNDVDLSFMDEDKVEEIEVGDTTVVFKEPTKEQRPKDTVRNEHEGTIGTDFWNPEGDWKSTVIGETPNGGRLQVMKREEGVGYRLAWQNGGVLPPECEGWFTSYDKAEQSARAYLNRIWESDE